MRSHRIIAIGLLSVLTLGACHLLVDVEDEPGVARPDAAVPDDVGTDANADATDPCVKRHPPVWHEPEGGAADGGSDGSSDFVFAVRTLNGTGALGYDLDERCTGIVGSTTSDSPCQVSTRPIVDSPAGVDNALGDSMKTLLLQGADDPFGKKTTFDIAQGKVTNLIGLFRYNGLANDPEVRVQIVMSGGLESTGCDGGLGAATPQWDGCDRWSYAPGNIENGLWVSTEAGYVVDDVLVLNASKPVKVALAGELPISEAILTARLVREGGVVVGLDDGILAGRMHSRDVITATQAQQTLGTVVCKNEGLFATLRESVCGVRDVPLRRADDGKGLACDAVSFAFGFSAHIVKLGNERAFPEQDCDGGFALDSSCPN